MAGVSDFEIDSDLGVDLALGPECSMYCLSRQSWFHSSRSLALDTNSQSERGSWTARLSVRVTVRVTGRGCSAVRRRQATSSQVKPSQAKSSRVKSSRVTPSAVTGHRQCVFPRHAG